MPQWTLEKTWTNVDGRSIPGMFPTSKGQLDYVMFMSTSDQVEMFWCDEQTSLRCSDMSLI